MYRLASPYENDLASLMYIDKDKNNGILFNYLTNWRYVGEPAQRPIRLQGLDSNKKYKLTEINLYGNQKSTIGNKNYSGDYLMTVGLNPNVTLSRSSVVIKIESVQ